MKKIIKTSIPFLIIIALIAFAGCRKNEVAKQEADNPFVPRIFDLNRVFTGTQVINQGDTVNYTSVSISPAKKAKISWKVNGKEVSTTTGFKFSPDTGGEFKIMLQVSYKGDTTSRVSNVLVNPSTYTLKPLDHVAMAYLTENGTAADIDWKNVNVVAYKVGLVTGDGSLDVSKGEINQVADEIIARAHIHEIPVILGVSGTLSGIDGWAIYERNDFGSTIRDPDKMHALVLAIKNYIENKKMDGVDIMMTDINSAAAPDNIHAIGPFLNALKAALPSKSIITVTVAMNYQHWEYPDLSAATWINVHAFEDNLHVGPGAPVGQSSSYDYMVSGAKIWENNHGIPANKIVLGIPAFGLRYDALDANGNNLSWGSYSYMTYRDILKTDSTVYDKEKADIGFGVYFNGVTLVKKKTEYIKDNGLKGAFLWAEDYDVMGSKSLMETIFKTLQ